MITKLLFIPSDKITGSGTEKITGTRTVSQYEFALFMDDGGKSVINGKEYINKKGFLRVLKPGDEIYSYRFNNVYVLNISSKIAEAKTVDRLPHYLDPTDADMVEDLYKKMLLLYIRNDELHNIRLKQYVYEFLYIAANSAGKYEKKSLFSPQIISSVNDVKKYIRENYKDDIQLEDMANSVHLHPNYMHRIFKQITEISPHEYLLNQRVTESERLLLSTNDTLSDIASACGFGSDTYFIYVFKKRCGCTPTQYRSENYKDAN